MHLLVTDRLACPRCGPEFGLVLLAEELRDRRVLEGALGCANCRERYPVRQGFGDLRPPPRSDPGGEGGTPEGTAEEAFRLAALIGVSEGPGLILLRDGWVAQASRLAAMIEEIEIVALDQGLRKGPEEPGVTRIVAADRLPFFSGSLRGLALRDHEPARELEEEIRVLGPGSRIVIRSPAPHRLERLEERGLEILLQTESLLVAARG